jgi:hypothetical protein
MICETCNEFFAQKNIKPYVRYRHHGTIEDLHRAALAQCQICFQLFRGVLRHYWNTFGPDENLSDQDKEQTMVSEIMAVRETYIQGLKHDFSLGNEDHFVRTFLELPKNDSFFKKFASGRYLVFQFEGKHFNTSRNKNRHVPNPHFHFFTMIPLESMHGSCIVGYYRLM